MEFMGLVVSRTALHWACKRSHVVIAEHLLRKGADVNLASTKGESVAQVTSDDQVLKLLSRYGLTKEAATVGTPENNSFEKQSPGFVPNYLQHPAWPYYDVQKNLEKLPDPDAHTVTTTAVPTYTDGEKRLPETIGDSLAKEMDQLHLLRTEKTSSSCKCGQNRPHPSPLLVKVRVSGSGESDFVEVEVAPPTYPTLVSACCEELELSPSDVAKIRKLPSVLVRKDRDVQRMAGGQELEVVLKGEGSIAASNT
ncbi:Putative ANKRD40 C-terminal-like protein [Geodia barretti]|uniref:ANKRD40 C-terminal-like protein n=1 Tax=Geodia barretti TaxID=519541 RepID=A0AA35WXI7_GEOBA|nr:Putative ANKRD40 C-terminal-like protein [Geodia barretti]